ncbi:TetR family transcriptional regulator [Paenibacillus glycanilyticus]|uniref:HTH-type transcriptional regulator YfiR n=1 Tax=Paenibacillus glycanilyticus TaxID=126569 RepID=A0ABQ6GPT6_9BACL|nr:TetR family transcriptional regulator [Paenibacillus glycanilyticus]GLX71047.1 putative HTH-type transcriptional regulator YfiR [Paenibacillus glycanilyticus]
MSPKISNDQKEQRRLQILEAGKRVFTAKGYAEATLKDIVEETGMSRGWIYLYFQTKEEIFEALLDYQDAEYDNQLQITLRNQSRVWEVIRGNFLQLQEELCTGLGQSFYPAFYEYFLTGSRDGARKSMLLKRYEDGINRFSELLQRGIDQDEFKPQMPVRDIARIIASYQEGIVTHSVAVGTETANSQVQIQALLDYLKQLLNLESEE